MNRVDLLMILVLLLLFSWRVQATAKLRLLDYLCPLPVALSPVSTDMFVLSPLSFQVSKLK